MSGRYPCWEADGRHWPNRAHSSFVAADDYDWHVQRMEPATDNSVGNTKANAPVCLLLHGTGAATHSWRDIMPLLASDYRVIAPDLPGHGFTRTNLRRAVSLPQMAASVAALLATVDAKPDLIVGHSAGAAIALQLALDQGWQVPIVGLNPALMPFPGLAAKIFPQLAKLLFTNPFAAPILAGIARGPGETERFLRRATGSAIDAKGTRYYQLLFSRSAHCDGAIRMMASWRLEPLQARLPGYTAPLLLVHGGNDQAIARSAVVRAATLLPGCETVELPKLGHLAHEEAPEALAAIIAQFAMRHQLA
jgi:magnesium chelatase accessory protein